MLLAALCLAPASSVAQAGTDELVDFPRRAREILGELGASEASPATFELGNTLETAFLHLDVALFRLHAPIHDFESSDAAENFKLLAGELIGLQRHWLSWTEAVQPTPESVHADFDTLDKWIASWPTSRLARLAKEGGGDVLSLMKAGEDVAAASDRLVQYMGKGQPLGLERPRASQERLVIVNDRQRFLGFLAFAGWLRPELQGIFWNSDVLTWTNFFVDDTKFVATTYYGGPDAPDGLPMSVRTKTGLEQQISQLAANSLIDNYLGARVPPALAGGLALNLVVDIYGECNTRVDGDLRQRRTEAREVFIPGAPSAGGFFPKDDADTRWRVKNQGKDRFIDELKAAQRSGAKQVRDSKKKNFAFAILDDKGVRPRPVLAPFLGPASADSEPPPRDYWGDYEEFLRAYRTCFVYWLKTESIDGDPAASGAAFAELLVGLAAGSSADQVTEALSDAYGVPLSTEDMASEALETRFLNWLPKASRPR